MVGRLALLTVEQMSLLDAVTFGGEVSIEGGGGGLNRVGVEIEHRMNLTTVSSTRR